MSMCKPSRILVGAALLSLATVGLATAAHADTTVIVSGDVTYDAQSGWSNPVYTPNAAFGPTVTIDVRIDSGTDEFRVFSTFLSKGGTPCDSDNNGCFLQPEEGGETFDVDPSASNAIVTLRPTFGGPFESLTETFTVSHFLPAEGASGAGPGPAPRVQQFPLPATGTCDEAQPDGLNWSGVASGGWSESWARWMNEGDGGHVCTRTLTYNPSTATWSVE
mgnify:CR=1 FL=1